MKMHEHVAFVLLGILYKCYCLLSLATANACSTKHKLLSATHTLVVH
jgi:hypothetical protein